MSGTHDHDQGCGCGCGCGAGPAAQPELEDRWRRAPDDEMVCPCRGVSKSQVAAAVAAGAYTLPLVKVMTGAGRGNRCAELHSDGRSCEADLEALIRIYGI